MIITKIAGVIEPAKKSRRSAERHKSFRYHPLSLTSDGGV